MLDKETWRKDYWFLFFICSLVWFLYTAKCEFTSKLRVGLPRVVVVLSWVLFVPEIYVYPLTEFEKHIYSSDPGPETGSLIQLQSRRAVPQASKAPQSKASARTFLQFHNSTAAKWKTTAEFGITHISFIFLFFDSRPGSCQPICGIIIANKNCSSAKAALVCSFRASGKNRRHLGCHNVMRSRGCAVQKKGITLRLKIP